MRLSAAQASSSWSPASPASTGDTLTTTANAPDSAPPELTGTRLSNASAEDASASVSMVGSQHGETLNAGDDDEEGALPDESDAAVDDEEELADESDDAEVAGGPLPSNPQCDNIGSGHRSGGEASSTSNYGRGRSLRRGSAPLQSEGAWTGGGSWSRRETSSNSYWQCLVPHILAPDADNSYYLAALRNAFNTLNEYAQFIGVDGSEFLKHLFSYYILGPRLTNDIISRLTPSATVEEGGPSVGSAHGSRSNRKHLSQQPYAADDPPVKKRRLRRREAPQADSPPEPVPSTLSIDLGFVSPIATTPNASMGAPYRSGVGRDVDHEGGDENYEESARLRNIRLLSESTRNDNHRNTDNEIVDATSRTPPREVPHGEADGEERPRDNDDLSDITESVGVKSNLSDLSSSSSEENEDEEEEETDQSVVKMPKKFQREAVVSAAILTPQKHASISYELYFEAHRTTIAVARCKC